MPLRNSPSPTTAAAAAAATSIIPPCSPRKKTTTMSVISSILPPRSPRKSPHRENKKKLRCYRVKDLLGDLETGDFSVYQASWMLRPFGWNGATVSLPGNDKDNNKLVHVAQQAVEAGMYQALSVLLTSCNVTQDETSQALLLLAAKPVIRDDELTALRLLLDHGAHTFMVDPTTGRNALSVAYQAHLQRKDKQQAIYYEFLSTLCLHTNVNLRNEMTGDTVLHEAIRSNDTHAVYLLLQHGAQADLRDGRGELPLVLAAAAARYNNKNDTCVRLLLRFGATLNDLNEIKDNDNGGWTPLHSASAIRHSVSSEYIQTLLATIKGANHVHVVDKDRGWTPLHVALAAANYATALCLLQHGASLDTVDHEGHNALQVVDWQPNNNEHDHQDEAATAFVNACLERGFDFAQVDVFVTARNDTLRFAMMQAAAAQGLFG